MILLFQPGTLVFDDDLVANASQSLETLVTRSGFEADNSFEWVKALDITQVLLKWSARTKRWRTSRKKISGMQLEGLEEVWPSSIMDSVNFGFIATDIRGIVSVFLFITMLCPYESEPPIFFPSTPMR